MTKNSSILKAKGLSKRFGGIQAVFDYELQVAPGEIVGLIGPNGAGKTTIFNLLSGVLKPTEGAVYFRGQDVTGAGPETISALGMARTFQNIRLFTDLSVLENVKVGFHRHQGKGFWSTIFNLPGYTKAEKYINERAREILDFFGLLPHEHEPAENLPYGAQRKLEIARALATEPKLLLLDEPAAGMNPRESWELLGTIDKLQNELGLAVLLVEHDMHFVMNICERLQVLVHGVLLTEGPPQQVQSDPEVIEAYLGSSRKGMKDRLAASRASAGQEEAS